MKTSVMLESELSGLTPRRGKVRDIYELEDNYVAIVATDRVSAFDQVMKTGIPQKGEILTALSLFWLENIKFTRPHHLVGSDVFALSDKRFHLPELARRTMICKKAERVVPFEAIVRGYLTGSAWEEYQKTGCVCEQKLPPGLREFDRLPEPMFTPSTKEEKGHDRNVSYEYLVGRLGDKWAEILRSRSLVIYNNGSRLAADKGLIIVDTKFEFGVDYEGNAMLVDEVLTPDSSRFISQCDWELRATTKPQSFDKQYLRNWLEGEILAGRWSKNSPGIELPDDVVEGTASRYRQFYAMLTGSEFPN